MEVKRNNKKFKSTKANAKGNFKVKIGVQKAGTSLTVTFKNEFNAIGSKKADKSGKYTIKITPQKSGTTVTATATDKAGNKSQPATRTVQ